MHDSSGRAQSAKPAAGQPRENVLGSLAVFSALALLALGLSLAGGCSKKSSTNPMGGGGGGGGTEPIESGVFTSGIFVHRFNTAGDYAYHCSVHGLSMSGTVHVAAAGDSPLVTIGNNFYNPSTVNVKAGDYVRWQANGTPHSVTR
jgi:hypothetical protein